MALVVLDLLASSFTNRIPRSGRTVKSVVRDGSCSSDSRSRHDILLYYRPATQPSPRTYLDPGKYGDIDPGFHLVAQNRAELSPIASYKRASNPRLHLGIVKSKIRCNSPGSQRASFPQYAVPDV